MVMSKSVLKNIVHPIDLTVLFEYEISSLNVNISHKNSGAAFNQPHSPHYPTNIPRIVQFMQIFTKFLLRIEIYIV